MLSSMLLVIERKGRAKRVGNKGKKSESCWWLSHMKGAGVAARLPLRAAATVTGRGLLELRRKEAAGRIESALGLTTAARRKRSRESKERRCYRCYRYRCLPDSLSVVAHPLLTGSFSR